MLIHNRIESSRVNGPGNRAVIWTQGCRNMNCPGCWNPETHAFDTSKDVSVEQLVNWVLSIPDIEGVTFSGGEPFQQTEELFRFCDLLKRREPVCSIGAYSGYSIRELREGQIDRRTRNGQWRVWASKWAIHRILSSMDFIVAGRFNQKMACDDKPLCGSRNQQVHFLTNRYSPTDLEPNMAEMLVDPTTGLVQMTGFPSSLGSL